MPLLLDDKLVVGISSRALFDLEEENRIFEEQGLQAYSEYQLEHENDILAPGTAFPLVKALHNLNCGEKKLTEIIVMSKNSADTSLRIFNSIKHYGLDITRAALVSGKSIAPYLTAFKTDLFLSADENDVQEAINANIAAGLICSHSNLPIDPDKTIDQIRIAFDGDAVIFSDESERIYQAEGLEAFAAHEEENAQNPLQVTYLRGGDENTVSFVPSVSKEDGKRKTGMWVRDTTAGIGTVTFVLPDTGEFAGLGHGICDAETGELLEMKRGTVVDVMISGVTKGVAGSPGELKGYFTSDKSGVLLGNTLCGVYGVMSNVPWETIPETAEVASRADIRPGEAYIWCTLDGNHPQKYSINITEIRRDVSMQDNRCFSIEVTDPVLLEKTGGIVQGMSGSPIIQNGKLIGAVTHVLINDPSKGYGIFIENMLEAAG